MPHKHKSKADTSCCIIDIDIDIDVCVHEVSQHAIISTATVCGMLYSIGTRILRGQVELGGV